MHQDLGEELHYCSDWRLAVRLLQVADLTPYPFLALHGAEVVVIAWCLFIGVFLLLGLP